MHAFHGLDFVVFLLHGTWYMVHMVCLVLLGTFCCWVFSWVVPEKTIHGKFNMDPDQGFPR